MGAVHVATLGWRAMLLACCQLAVRDSCTRSGFELAVLSDRSLAADLNSFARVTGAFEDVGACARTGAIRYVP